MLALHGPIPLTEGANPGFPLPLGRTVGMGAPRWVSVVWLYCWHPCGDFALSAERSGPAMYVSVQMRSMHVPGGKHTDVSMRQNTNVYNNFPQLRHVLEQKISILGVRTSIL